MSEFLRVLENEVQIIALSFMAVVYLLRLRWILKFTASKERTPSRGDETAGIMYSYMTLAMPWSMESTSKRWIKYIEFVIFHIGIVVTITATFIIPYAPALIGSTITIMVIQVIIAAAFIVGVIRLFRRFARPEMRAISSMDDYFSLLLLDFYLLSAFFGVPNNNEWSLIAFFGLTTFFLIYVPFSKISHYLYFPFTRYYIGKHLGHRGVYPKKLYK